jgi:MFS family permease
MTQAQDGAKPATKKPATLADVALASTVGTALEWFDFYLYGTAAALVFGKVFFPANQPGLGTIASFGTLAIGFLARPVGGIIAGHFGDRVGRRVMLVITLSVMGVATFLIGFLPTYRQVGIWAPVLLVALRIVQGLAVGGEWAGAILMTFEHAKKKRGFYSALPQAGSPMGLLLATGAFILTTGWLSQEQFVAWGWRLPFWSSLVVVVVGLFVRLRLLETPEFTAVKEQKAIVAIPLVETVSRYWRSVLLVIGARWIEGLTFNIYAVFALSYMGTHLNVPRNVGLTATTIASAIGIFTTPLFGALSDRFERWRVFAAGALFCSLFAFPFFLLVESKSPFVIIVAMVLALAVGADSVWGVEPSLFSELFAANVRYTGISIGFQLSGVFASGCAPLIAVALLQVTGSWWPIAAYVTIMGVISALCAYLTLFVKKPADQQIDSERRPELVV